MLSLHKPLVEILALYLNHSLSMALLYLFSFEFFQWLQTSLIFQRDFQYILLSFSDGQETFAPWYLDILFLLTVA